MKFEHLYQRVRAGENSQDEEEEPHFYSKTGTFKFRYLFLALIFVIVLYFSIRFLSSSSPKICELDVQSTKYVPECNMHLNNTWPLLISATPRSGTVRTQKLFASLSFNITDDWGNPGKHGTVSWMLAFRDSPRGYFGPVNIAENESFEHVVHQIREPLASITSMAFTEPWDDENYFSFVNRHIDLPPPPPNMTLTKKILSDEMRLSFALRMWVQWHEFLDEISEFHFKMENLTIDVMKKIIKIANLTMPSDEKFQKLQFKKIVNARKHREKISWEELKTIDFKFFERAQILATKYNYETIDKN